MPQPEPYIPPSWDKKSSAATVLSQDQSNVTEVARTLAAHGGGVASLDLALDLVLNDVVEQARLATGATGAAIALARAGEMVCRATAGEDAPDLGVRLETTSGLSGACLQTGEIQQCGDTETDPRVNAAACRRLGVRSILILPLGEGREPFGAFEVFSSRANAFGDRDVNTLQVLARRVVESVRRAEGVTAVPVSPNSDSLSSQPESSANEMELRQSADSESAIEPRSPQQSEIATSILGILVILVAVLLGLVLGWRGAVVRGFRQGSKERSSAAKPTQAMTVEEQKPASAAPAALPSTSAAVTSQTKASTSVIAGDPPAGGLVVRQYGKVIYRSPPGVNTAPRASGIRDVSGNRLIHRVEPEYPADARAQHLQGSVTLEVRIGGEGNIHNIAVVEGNPLLAEAAVQAVRQWKYLPYSVEGRPVEMQTRITIRFTLPPLQ